MSKKLDLFREEREISGYKTFYKNHLAHINNRKEVLSGLDYLRKEAKKSEPRELFNPDRELTRLEIKIDDFLKKNFNKKVIELYNKEIYDVSEKVKNLDTEQPFLLDFFRGISELYVQSNIKIKKQWEYKIKVLDYLHDSIYNYGLHSNISKRIPEIHKKFNLVIHHEYRSNERITDYKIMMSYDEFEKIFINQYSKKKPITISGKHIPFIDIHQVKITTTLLKNDEIELFAQKNNFSWSSKHKDYKSFVDNCKDDTDTYLPNPFEESTDDKLNQIYIQDVQRLLISYPASLKLYLSALNKLNKGGLERNLLDDLRLSLELLLKEIFNNNKSLENQLSILGEYLNKRGTTKEMTNMFHKLIKYYTDYQNNYVKHNDLVQKNGVEFIFDLTGTFIKYLVKEVD